MNEGRKWHSKILFINLKEFLIDVFNTFQITHSKYYRRKLMAILVSQILATRENQPYN